MQRTRIRRVGALLGVTAALAFGVAVAYSSPNVHYDMNHNSPNVHYDMGRAAAPNVLHDM
jgi:hypothetical protein